MILTKNLSFFASREILRRKLFQNMLLQPPRRLVVKALCS